MRKVVRLTESDLIRIVKRVILEQENESLPDCKSNASLPHCVSNASLPDCVSFITGEGVFSIREPMDPEMVGQGTTIKNVEIKYNPTVSPGSRSITMSKNGVPFCSTKVG